ncbi:MAG: hypothetical protein COA76_02520 [Moritella sp.]|uniref:hypothetical protein n=1 Tax=unclassified Moritella TaxID=2637987 RepID=UPI0001569631|nr:MULTISPECIES: hypothetical protein [unclassified Moritella]EDM66406.1 Hep_Hag family [Moritella sp. PE36]MBL1416823.1 hypothetical protein [Moritella sp.]PHR89916.1 MAG: hypothetical protein COA76_02520 [Moritella sp.]
MTFKKLTTLAAIPLLSFSLHTFADEVINDDLIISSSLCVGIECVDGEDFGFDTIRLKDDNPQIRFVDTSSTSSFPSNDWLMGANDDSNAGLPHFFIKDVTGDSLVLQLTAGENGGVALGAGSTLEDNSISVGSVGNERKIVHVAAGVNNTDAVNVAQFNQYKIDVEVDIATKVDDLSLRIDALITQIKEL